MTNNDKQRLKAGNFVRNNGRVLRTINILRHKYNIPKWESIRRNARDREIRALFNGGNYKALALQFDLSERQIYKIISGTRT